MHRATPSPSARSVLAIAAIVAGLALAVAIATGCDVGGDPPSAGTSLADGDGPWQRVQAMPDGSAFAVALDENVPGNPTAESLADLWPLHQGAALRMYSHKNHDPEAGDGRLQIKVEAPRVYEGQLSWPVNFVKDSPSAYWGPGGNENLRWLVVGLEQSSEPYLWARGDEHFDRGALPAIVMSGRTVYDSLSPGIPPYVLFPRQIDPNPSNSGLGNFRAVRHDYLACHGVGCTPVNGPGHITWFMGVRNARLHLPAFGDTWIDAKWIEYVEVTLPGEWNDPVTAPYTGDRAAACRTGAGGQPYFRGVREDWFLVRGLGPALILTRDIGLGADRECVYDVVRQPLDFDDADSYSFLVQADDRGYDPTWSF